ncbi:proteasome subunit beta type-1-like isoform X2 [Coffea arabica]|uniref:Proteasome subunit beta type-1-like isoform X2 n=1 Tax=Coffea arabica TaxID=13443 RepID=A0ABM4UQ45_COFAR
MLLHASYRFTNEASYLALALCILSSHGMIFSVKELLDLAPTWKIYQHQHNKQMSTPAMAQLLLNTFYYKRFFAYHAFMFWGSLMVRGRGVSSHVTPLDSMKWLDIVNKVLVLP